MLDLDLKQKSYGRLKMTVQTMSGNVAPLFHYSWTRFGTSQPFRNCEMRVTVLRNGTRVPKCAKWQLRNTLQNGALVRNQALPLHNAFRSCEMDAPVLRSGTRVPKVGFAAAKSSSK